MGEFDKIIKENIEKIFQPILNKLLDLSIAQSFEIKDKIQRTLEREPDFLKRVIDTEGNEFILHLEFQTNDNPEMVYRMAEYKAILQRKYRLPVSQFVIYLGDSKPNMQTQLAKPERITGFKLKDIHQLSTQSILESDIPEEIILAVLTDYPKTNAIKVIGSIIEKLQQCVGSEDELFRFIQQLLVLARLRKLHLETKQIIEAMPITYDITKDELYLEGLEKGIEKDKHAVILKALKSQKLTIEEIADLVDVSVDYVLKVQSESL